MGKDMRMFKSTYFCASVLLFSFPLASAQEDPYSAYQEVHGDLHVHSSTGSFDAKSCQGACKVLSVTEQLSEARAAGRKTRVSTRENWKRAALDQDRRQRDRYLDPYSEDNDYKSDLVEIGT